MQRMLTETEKLEITEHEWVKARAKNPEVIMRVNVQDETDESRPMQVSITRPSNSMSSSLDIFLSMPKSLRRRSQH